MNRMDFLPQDIQLAIAHFNCCLACLSNAGFFLEANNFEMAKKRLVDFERSLDELKRLKQKKERQDQLRQMVEKLVSQGVLIDLVSLKRRENS
jgi:hypothetical protein